MISFREITLPNSKEKKLQVRIVTFFKIEDKIKKSSYWQLQYPNKDLDVCTTLKNEFCLVTVSFAVFVLCQKTLRESLMQVSNSICDSDMAGCIVPNIPPALSPSSRNSGDWWVSIFWEGTFFGISVLCKKIKKMCLKTH